MKKGLAFFIMASLHIVAVAGIIAVFWPMADWYFHNPTLPPGHENIQAKPLWGVDFFYTASLVNLLSHNFVLPNVSWGYAWFSGWPALSSYPILHYYFIVPLTAFFSLIDAIKIWMLASLAIYFIGIYAVCFVLSRNFAVSFVLSFAAIYSVGVYGTLMWGGSLPSHATQAFFPWVLFFIIVYLRNQRKIYLFFSALLAGLAILAHPQVVIAYIYPSAVLLFIFSFGTLKLFQRIKSMFIFLIISFLIGFPLLYSSMGGALQFLFLTDINNVASSTVRMSPGAGADVAAFHQAQPYRIFIDTNSAIFLFLGASVVLFFLFLVFKNRGRRLLEALPFVVLAVFSTAYVWMFAYGISIYHGGWYRLFWAVPFWLGMLTAAFWGAWQEQAKAVIKKRSVYLPLYIVLNIVVLIVGFSMVNNSTNETMKKIIPRSATSSAFPNILNLRTSDQERKELKVRLIPSWMDGDNKQYRMYAGDQTINIWWNSLYSMPLARGYFDPPVSAKNKGYFFLTDASLSQSTKGKGEDQLVGEFNYPQAVAINNTLYFIDWYGIKYIESGPTMAAFTPLPKSFNNSMYIKRDALLEFNSEKYNTGGMSLHYYEVKNEYTSPIFLATNAPTLGIIGTDTGYETIQRTLADMNFSSKQVVPVKLGQFIDKLKTSDLLAMDALIVYDYNYSDRGNAYRLLSDYLKKGKRIFIDTGVEVKEANSEDLPEVFPMGRSERKPLGKEWQFEISDSELTGGIDFSVFDPPIFDKQSWSQTYPIEESDVREGSKILLKNKGKPVMIAYEVNGGQVIWSGLNLPYHTIRTHNTEEVRFFKGVLEKLLAGTGVIKEPVYETQFRNPQKRQITLRGAKGVLFKEQAYPGWSAWVSGDQYNKNLEIFKAGPAYPGFMYVRLPDSEQKATVTLSYSGSMTSWIVSVISAIIVLLIMEETLLKGAILGRFYKSLFRKSHKHIKSWWSKDDIDE